MSDTDPLPHIYLQVDGGRIDPTMTVTDVKVGTEPQLSEDEPVVALAKETVANLYCSAKDCENSPEFGFVWPGQDKPSRQCQKHAVLAIRVADVMGFKLVVWRLS